MLLRSWVHRLSLLYSNFYIAKGEYCEVEINECTENGQTNGNCVIGQGACIDKINGFDCECYDGYSGTRCQNGQS